MNLSELFKNSLSGNLDDIFEYKNILYMFSNEIKIAIELIISILLIIIIHSLFKTIIENLGNSSSSQIVYFVQYLLITSVVINYFISILDLTQNAISDIVDFMNLFVPLMVTLMLTTGAVSTTSVVQPVLIFIINFIGNFINIFIIPVLLVSITISIVSNFSDKVQIGKISKFLKSSIVWILGIILTIFACTLSLEGSLTSSVDGLSAKTAKAAVSNFIPVVGKIMGDTVESVIGCANILKNAVGLIGVVIIIGIVAIPLIKVLILWFSFKLAAAVCETVADSKIIKLMEQVADSYKILLAILFSVSIMFVIGITIVIKISNGAVMYR